MTPAQAIRDLALQNEFARRRALNNIPERHLTPIWLELAIARDWTLVRGEPSETRARAEAEARAQITVAEIEPPFRPASGEAWAVIAVDPGRREGTGCAGVVQSFHPTESEAELAARTPA